MCPWWTFNRLTNRDKLPLNVGSNRNRLEPRYSKRCGEWWQRPLLYTHAVSCPSTNIVHLDVKPHFRATAIKTDNHGLKPQSHSNHGLKSQKPQEKENFPHSSCSCHSDKSCLMWLASAMISSPLHSLCLTTPAFPYCLWLVHR